MGTLVADAQAEAEASQEEKEFMTSKSVSAFSQATTEEPRLHVAREVL